MTGAVGFVTWDDERPSGGTTYNRELVAALRAAGTEVAVRALPGSWPQPSREETDRLARALTDHPVAIVDGIVASGAPDALARAVAAGHAVLVLVHMATADEVGLDPDERDRRERTERQALHAATTVIATSRTAAADLTRRHDLDDVRLARPGMRRGAVAVGSDPPRLLALGTLSPTKDQATFVRALGLLRDLPWTARLIGPHDAVPEYATDLATLVGESALGDRVSLPGPRTGADLEDEWHAADLLVLSSRTETYGLVVAEALAHGVPAVVSAGTGAVEALGDPGPDGHLPGCAVAPGDAVALAAVLRRWLTDPSLRTALRRSARDRRQRLPGWDTTAAVVADLLAEVSSRPGAGR
ncbi:glycosyltransferase family 4 protein [Georgenia deserti]|uniref:Glycosyltransferase family 4 protein n=1 Tax=Georgenia deserti TaxID=2093781 RepID=A0ABW4L8X2_9MICO